MKKTNKHAFTLLFALLTVVLTLSLAAQVKNISPAPYAAETPTQRDARLQWFREAKFGKSADKVEGVKFLRMENGAAVFAVGSGQYHFQSSP